MIPTGVERSHVEQALARIDAEGIPGGRTSKHWALEHNGKRYPPKLVVSLAAEMATGQALPSTEFSAGDSGGARSLLRRLGFSVLALDDSAAEDDEDDALQANDIERWLRTWYPDPGSLQACSSLLADAIGWSHQQGPASWVCATRGQNAITLTVGRSLVVRLQRESVSIVVAADALTPNARAQLKARSTPGTWEFKSVAGSESYVVVPSTVASLRPLFEEALRMQITRTASAVKQSPYTRNQENQILDALEHLLHRSLPRPSYAVPAPVATVDWARVAQAFQQFRDDPGERFRVELRRVRARQLRAFLATPEAIHPETFNLEVWTMESRTLLRGQEITGQLLRGAEVIPPETAAAWTEALTQGALELHGNYVWGSGSRIFGPTLTDEERVQHIQAALALLNDAVLSPLEKAIQIEERPGFGPNIATGLVMVFHPTEFSLWNKVSRSLLPQFGYRADELAVFETSTTELRQRLGAEDALELDWFLFLLSTGRYREVFPAEASLEGSSRSRRVLKIAPGENASYWKDCLEQGIMVVGWDEVGDLRKYPEASSYRAAFNEKFSGIYRNNKSTMGRAANELWALRDLRPGDVIVANRGKSEILGVGEVVAPGYEFLPERAGFKHAVHVAWDTTKARKVPTQEGWMRTIVPVSESELKALIELTDDKTPPSGLEAGTSAVAPPITLAQILSAIEGEGMRLEARTVRRYHVALQVRGFVILAGVSGTGKTWLTRAYASAIKARYLLVAVAPSWTSNEDLLGYFNPLSKTYLDTGVSRFVREAAAEYRLATEAGRSPQPFHLVLDEMNLAKVEHYFARFLSALEVRQRDTVAELELHAGETVLLPPNLAFIGTVNVDETTHGFSDKVYDRAQLLELPVSRDLLAQHVADQACGETVMKLWEAVAPVAPFAFRVADDIVDYVERSVELSVDWKEALDEQIVQKVLTKLKGADPRIATALENVLTLTEGQFPLSHERAQRMLEGFRQHGFASFF